MSDHLLKIENISKSFGGVQALENINIDVKRNQITGVIGPNGAGKSTLFNIIVGIYKPDSGAVILDDKNITGLANYKIHRLGISRTFQNIRLFNKMTILENLLSGANFKTDASSLAYANELLIKMNLYDLRYDYPSSLDYGSKKRLEVGRALMAQPKLLMLDEPAAGMNESETLELMNFIQEVSTSDISILIIEHDMKLIMTVCDEINVLNFGKLIAAGTAEEVAMNKEVREAYLGKDYDYARN